LLLLLSSSSSSSSNFILSLHNGVNSTWIRLNYDIDDGYDYDNDIIIILVIASLLDTQSCKFMEIP
jgi:hypothetical protein